MQSDYFECPQCKSLKEIDYKKGEEVLCKKCKVAMRKIKLGSSDETDDGKKGKKINRKARGKRHSNGNR